MVEWSTDELEGAYETLTPPATVTKGPRKLTGEELARVIGRAMYLSILLVGHGSGRR